MYPNIVFNESESIRLDYKIRLYNANSLVRNHYFCDIRYIGVVLLIVWGGGTSAFYML